MLDLPLQNIFPHQGHRNEYKTMGATLHIRLDFFDLLNALKMQIQMSDTRETKIKGTRVYVAPILTRTLDILSCNLTIHHLVNAFLEQPNYLKLPNSTTYHKSYFISDMFSLMSLIFAFQMTSNILHIVQAMQLQKLL